MLARIAPALVIRSFAGSAAGSPAAAVVLADAHLENHQIRPDKAPSAAPLKEKQRQSSWGGGCELAYDEVWHTEPASPYVPVRTAVFVHGLLGSGRNWRSIARRLAADAAAAGTPWRFLLVDLRGHANSYGRVEAKGPNDLAAVRKGGGG